MVAQVVPFSNVSIKRRVINLIDHTLVQNVLSLSGAQIAGYLVPLVTIPYLARVLGAAGWGLVAFTQSFGTVVTLFAEYGFAFSAAREVARYRNDSERLTNIIAGVLGAKGLIAAGAVAVSVLIRWWVPAFREHPVFLQAGMFWALSQAFSMMWFFQGMEKMRIVAALDISTKALATLAIFIFVRRPGDGWVVLIAQGCGFLLSFVIGMILAYRTLSVRLPTWSSAWKELRTGWTMFLFRGSSSLYTVGNAFILGLFVSPQLVGYYAGAEKITRALHGLLSPVSAALYPRLSHLVRQDRVTAARLARASLLFLVSGGGAIGTCVCAFAPQIVRLILGSTFLPAVPILRILSLLVPLMAANTALGVLWMLPLGLDRILTLLIFMTGLINVSLASALASFYAGIGMAWAVVSAEAFLFCGMSFVLNQRKVHPMSHLVSIQKDIAGGGPLQEVP